eukprot:g3824.t1
MLRALAIFCTLFMLVRGSLNVPPAAGITLETAADQGSWAPSSPAATNEVADVVFMLRHEPGAVAELEATALAVSDPRSHRYGQYLSAAQAAAALPSCPGCHAAVADLLTKHGVMDFKTGKSGDMITASISSSVAARVFAAKLQRFEHPAGGSMVRAQAGYTVPPELESKIYLVGGLNEFPDVGRMEFAPPTTAGAAAAPAAAAAASAAAAATRSTAFGDDCDGCAGRVTPQILQQAYNLPNSTLRAGSNTSTGGMATAEFQGVAWAPGALEKFESSCRLPKGSVQVDKQIGPNVAAVCRVPVSGLQRCMEACLDVEYAKAVIGPHINLTNIASLQFSLLNWAQQVDGLGDAGPAVHSISYGTDEGQQPSQAFMDAVTAQLVKLAARGVSVLVASGDQGVAGRTGCKGKHHHAMHGPFHADFPASSPYVTAVGGTNFVEDGVVGPEEAWSRSGGGFSHHFSRPSWQSEAVDSYLTKSKRTLPPSNKYNATGRAYPDVAALGGGKNPYCVSLQGALTQKMYGVMGTSASTPVVAGIVARLNEARLAAGKPRLGWLNPFFYRNPGMFNDVTTGANTACASSQKGFSAADGWDPVTGLGTPDYSKMLKAALAAGQDA